MLPRSQRVSKTLFETTMRASKTYHSPFLSIRVGFNTESVSRFSCVVSKKIDKRAVRRNALRRNMYNVLGNLVYKTPKGCVVLVFAKKGCELLKIEDLQKEIELLLDRAGLRIV